MNLRCKKKRELTREETAFRDDRLFIVASEDTHAAVRYFELFKNSRIKVRVLPTEGGRSAPDHVLQRLDDYKTDYDLMAEDQLWLMLDTDHWTDANHVPAFARVCAEAIKKDYRLAHSNPCFEVWLFLHFAPLGASDRFVRCADVIDRLKNLLGGYRKRTIDPASFDMKSVSIAVQRAAELDNNSSDRWPQSTGTHVYKIVRQLI